MKEDVAMDEIRAALASNLIRLRQSVGISQAELGAILNYSDKAVSKWERGESVPDIAVIKHISEYYGVSVDDLLTPYDESSPVLHNLKDKPEYSTNAITAVSILSIWTMAVFAFVLAWMFGHIIWQIFILAIPLSLIAFLVFHSIWNNGRFNLFIIMGLIASILLSVYIVFLPHNFWQLFLLLVPANLVVYASFRIRDKKLWRHKEFYDS